MRERIAPTAVTAGGHPVHPTRASLWRPEARTAARAWTDEEPLPNGKRLTIKRVCGHCQTVLGDLTGRDFAPLPPHQHVDDEDEGCWCEEAPVLADVRGECPTCTPQPGRALVGPVRWVPGVPAGLTPAEADVLMRSIARIAFWPEPSPIEDEAYGVGFDAGVRDALGDWDELAPARRIEDVPVAGGVL